MRRIALRALLIAGLAALTFGMLAAFGGFEYAAVGSPASSSQYANRLSASVIATNRGPLPACSGSGCTNANVVWHFIYVENKNSLTNLNGGTTRATLPNTFVVSSVDQTVFVDRVQFGGVGTFAPPPNIQPSAPLIYSGHWPSTVRCPPGGPPCNVVNNPAIVPGENTAVLYVGWVHGTGEPDGAYVFRYTVHGTLNGVPMDLTASSPRISMTR